MPRSRRSIVEGNQPLACAATPRTGFIDVTSPLLGANGLPIGACYQPDGLHLNAVGYLRWAQVLKASALLVGRMA